MNFWVISLLVSGFLYLCLAGFVWTRFSDKLGAKSFMVIMISLGFYSICYYLRIHYYDVFWFKIEYIFGAPLPAFWLIFVLQFTNSGQWLNKRRIAALFLIPVITWLTMITNNSYHLLFKYLGMEIVNGLGMLVYIPGVWFWVDVMYLNLSILVGNIFLFLSWINTPAPFNKQFATMFLGSLVPWIAFVVYISGKSPIDLSAFGMIITGLVYTFNLIHYRLFENSYQNKI